ncbi:MAG TPA: TRAP transporter small permease subunit, partial [Stellaceae bacterium]|nr:TRAP transporter small permease subunit [Stellaceae bacterium]
MNATGDIVLQSQRHLKWRALDLVERFLMALCGICLLGFTTSVFFDVLTREIGHPWLWLQEVTSTFFIYGIFIGAGVATRRADHLYLAAMTELMTGRLRFT